MWDMSSISTVEVYTYVHVCVCACVYKIDKEK